MPDKSVSMQGMRGIAKKRFEEYQAVEHVPRKALVTVTMTIICIVILIIANELKSPRLQLFGAIVLILVVGLGGFWTTRARSRALAKSKAEKGGVFAPFL